MTTKLDHCADSPSSTCVERYQICPCKHCRNWDKAVVWALKQCAKFVRRYDHGSGDESCETARAIACHMSDLISKELKDA